MKKSLLLFIICCILGSISLYAQETNRPLGQNPTGWKYYGGDEFDDSKVNSLKWGVYGAGTEGKNLWSSYMMHNEHLLSYFNVKNVLFETDKSGDKVCRLASIKATDGKHPVWNMGTEAVPNNKEQKDKTAWYTGGLSSRDSDENGGTYFPLYSRIEIRAKTGYVNGLWPALWCRHFKGASRAELDILEFFTKGNTAVPQQPEVRQTTHLFNYGHKQWKETDISSNPGQEFHIYGVQIEQDPTASGHAIITYLLDGVKTDILYTKNQKQWDANNNFITDAKGRENRVWDIALTNKVGGKFSDVGYPAAGISTHDLAIDWVRVYTPTENTPPPTEAKTYQHLIMYGQSLAAGQQSYPVLSTESVSGNYMFGDQVWIFQQNKNQDKYLSPLKATIANASASLPKTKASLILAEVPIVGLTNHLQLKDPGKNMYLSTTVAVPGASIERLSEGFRWEDQIFYDNYFIKSLEYARSAIPAGSTLNCPAIFYMQGEANYRNASIGANGAGSTDNKDAYKALLIQLKSDMQQDAKAAYSQTALPKFYVYQTRGVNFPANNQVSIGMAQLEASNASKDMICVGPLYQMTSRGEHLDPNGYRWYGEMMAKVYHITQTQGKEFKPLQPKKISRVNGDKKKLSIQYHLPIAGTSLKFDTQTLQKVADYGFEVYNNGVKQAFASDPVIEGDKVVITCAANLDGEITVTYANPVSAKAGNLRDTDSYKAFYKYENLSKYPSDEGTLLPEYEPKNENGTVIYDKPYPLYNFSMAFYYKLASNATEHVVKELVDDSEVETKPLYMIGSSTSAAWNINNAVKMTLQDGVYTWTGTLNKGELKFLTSTTQWAPGYLASFGSEPVIPGYKHQLIYNASAQADNKFVIRETGKYTVKIDVDNKWMVVQKEEGKSPIYLFGSATSAGWSNQNVLEMTELTESGNLKYTWTGHLDPGEFKFLTEKGTWNVIIPKGSDNQKITSGTAYPISNFRGGNQVFSITDPGTYTLSLTMGQQGTLVAKKIDNKSPIYLLGNATPVGWNNQKAIELTQIDGRSVYVWEGTLSPGDFKFITKLGTWNSITPAIPRNEDILSGYKHNVTQNGNGDYRFRVVLSGDYLITLDMEKKTLQLIKATGGMPIYILGDATSTGWNNKAAQQMEQESTEIYTWTGFLDKGQFKFIRQLGTWSSILPGKGANEVIKSGESYPITNYDATGRDPRFVIAEKGTYKVTLNTGQKTLVATLIDKKSPIYLLGSATSVGWDNTKALEMTQADATKAVYTWTGSLQARDFKFISKLGTWNSVMPDRGQSELVIPSFTHKVTNSSFGRDPRFYLKTTGIYSIVLNLDNNTMLVTKEGGNPPIYLVGSATPNGWNNKSATELKQNADGLYVWEGAMQRGQFKFITQLGTWNSIIPESNKNQDVVAGTSYGLTNIVNGDYRFNLSEGGIYLIEADLANKTMKLKRTNRTSTDIDQASGVVIRPMQGRVDIDILSNITVNDAQLIDLQGRVLARSKDNLYSFSLGEGITKGVYIVKLVYDSKTVTQKVVVQ